MSAVEWTAETEIEYVIEVPVKVKLSDMFTDPDDMRAFFELSPEAQYQVLAMRDGVECAIDAQRDGSLSGFWTRLRSEMDDWDLRTLPEPASFSPTSLSALTAREKSLRTALRFWEGDTRPACVWGAGGAGAGGVR